MGVRVLAAVGVDSYLCGLPGVHRGELVLLEVRDDPDVVEAHDGEQGPLRRDHLPRLDSASCDLTAKRRAYRHVGEVQLRLCQRSLGLVDAGVCYADLRVRRINLLRTRLRANEAPARDDNRASRVRNPRLRRGEARLGLVYPRDRLVENGLLRVSLRLRNRALTDEAGRAREVELSE